ncbi:MAG: hypothetical protein LBH09_05015 [Peptococcaceae bacterium]|jgi:TRAP-type C4-dicarboxylate transport system substrate-binding protein|nr:hypothetical protein [Peptococcaceae bacterium]
MKKPPAPFPFNKLIMLLIVMTVLYAGCGGTTNSSIQNNPPAQTISPAQNAPPTQNNPTPQNTSSGQNDPQSQDDPTAQDTLQPPVELPPTPPALPELAKDASVRASDAYALIADLKQKASAYDAKAADYRYILNCHDPAASAAGEFLYAWSDAVLAATEGKVYIEVGVSNAYSTGGAMATFDEMLSGYIDFDWTLPCYFSEYFPLSLVIQHPALGIKNATAGSFAIWDLYQNNPDIRAEFANSGKALFVWTGNPSPLSYRGAARISGIGDIKGNVRGDNGPAQIFINEAGANAFDCPVGDIQAYVPTGALNYLIMDWHGLASLKLSGTSALNHYLDANIGSPAYCLMASDSIWAEIVKNGYADAIQSVSGDYLLNLVGIWEAYEATARQSAAGVGGMIYPPDDALAEELQAAFENVAETWISDTGESARQVYDQAVTLADKYNAMFD